jgi:hypothetical protein
MNDQKLISVLVDIPEGLHETVQTYLRSIQGAGQSQDSVFTEALALYMLGKGLQGLIPNPLHDDGNNLFKREGK